VVLDDTVAQPAAVLSEAVLTELSAPAETETAESDPETALPAGLDSLPEIVSASVSASIETSSTGSPAPVERTPRFCRKAIHPAGPMPQPVAYVVERQHCPDHCQACEEICPNQALSLDQTEAVTTITAGAIVVATGWDPYRLDKLPEYGFGVHPNVISSLEMERLLADDDRYTERLSGFSPGDYRRVGFIQCAGSRDERHLTYCSGVCCSATLKQIQALKARNPSVECIVYYMHIRTPGFDENLYRSVRDAGEVVFIRERPAQVDFDPETGRAVIESLDENLGKRIRTEMDLLVLAGGMIPAADGIEVGQVLQLPTNPFGFFESHRQCYPAESQRTGIFAAGCAREPMNVSQSIESGVAAAMRALPFLSGSHLIEPTYPEVNEKKCDSCGRCVEECPFTVLTFDEKKIPVPDLARCRQCGNCMGICPKIAVNLRGSTIKQYAAQIEVLAANSFLPKNEPILFAFLCENDAWLAHRQAQRRGWVPAGVVALPVPCAGSVNNALIADALSFGIDGVYIGACPDGTCHYVRGNELIHQRRDDLAEKLRLMKMESERVTIENLGPRDVDRYVESLTRCIATLKDKGPNPFKL
jgi:coenzyme F420-reducing hydrogenase delta subunit/ferredoxin